MKLTIIELHGLLACVNTIEAGGQYGEEDTDNPDLKSRTIKALQKKLRAELRERETPQKPKPAVRRPTGTDHGICSYCEAQGYHKDSCPTRLPVCPNCQQWQHPPAYDCANECAKRGFAKYGVAPHAFAGGVVTPNLCVACNLPKEEHR